MSILLTLAYLFFIGSILGWILELLFRNLTEKHEKWVNPGFCTGPYLPIYGFGLCVLYLLASLEQYQLIQHQLLNKAILFLTMAVGMTLIEYISGLFCLKYLKVRLWDYSAEWGNIQGIICPRFSLFWAIGGAIYYFLIHPHILNALSWLSHNLAFSFFIGMFFGVFIIDVAHSGNLIIRLKRFAEENEIVVRYEELKKHILTMHEKNKIRYLFFQPFREIHPLNELLLEMKENLNERKERHEEKHNIFKKKGN